jgi:hypothetical protein
MSDRDSPQEIIEDRQEDKLDKIIGPMDSNFPLLKEFRNKAPGSRKHAQSLVSMVENVCAAIDKDPGTLKMKVGKINDTNDADSR